MRRLTGFLLLACTALSVGVAAAQTATAGPADELEAVVILARHGIRAPIESEIRASTYNAQAWPAFPTEPGVITPHGAKALLLLGGYYRARYASLFAREGHCGEIYAEANTTSRTLASAQAMLAGMAPECRVRVQIKAAGQWNPLFSPAEPSPVAAQVLDATDGRVGDHWEWFSQTFTRPMNALAEVMQRCERSECNHAAKDFRMVRPTDTGLRQDGLRPDLAETPPALGADFAEHLLLEYVEGLPMEEVGWGRVERAELDQLMEMNTRFHDFMLRTPLAAQVAGSDLAERILLTLESRAGGAVQPGELGTPGQRVVLLDGHDSNLAWMGGLLRVDWAVGDGPLNATPPGGALVFELHRDPRTKALTVRMLFVSQTLDQMRFLTPLRDRTRVRDGVASQSGTPLREDLLQTGAEPSVAPVFVPGCSGPAPFYACTLAGFRAVVAGAIDRRYLEPGVR